MTHQIKPRLDVHAHVHDFATWDMSTALAEQDRFGIGAQVLSIPLMPESPTYYRSAGPRTAREVNERLAAIVAERPDRFGAFGILPGDDADAAVDEVTHALDELGLDGICLLTNSRGRYLGDAFYESVLGAVADRGAPVFLHPVMNPMSATLDLGRPGFLLEVAFDTARSVTDGIYAGVLDRLPDLQLILAHNGGALPSLAWRIESFTEIGRHPGQDPVDPASVRAALARLHYDIGLASGRPTLAAVLAVAGAGQMLYGSDLGAAPDAIVEANLDALLGYGLPADELAAVERHNAVALFPRFQ